MVYKGPRRERTKRHKWHYPSREAVLKEQREWLEKRKAQGAKRQVVEGQIRHAGRSPNHPPLKNMVDEVFGKE
jgi:hypothetical protein